MFRNLIVLSTRAGVISGIERCVGHEDDVGQVWFTDKLCGFFDGRRGQAGCAMTSWDFDWLYAIEVQSSVRNGDSVSRRRPERSHHAEVGNDVFFNVF
jgi:hypothetical protein